MRRQTCASCDHRFLTFAGLMRHVVRNHPHGNATCPTPLDHHVVDGEPGELICTKCGLTWNPYPRYPSAP